MQTKFQVIRERKNQQDEKETKMVTRTIFFSVPVPMPMSKPACIFTCNKHSSEKRTIFTHNHHLCCNRVSHLKKMAEKQSYALCNYISVKDVCAFLQEDAQRVELSATHSLAIEFHAFGKMNIHIYFFCCSCNIRLHPSP